MNNNSSRFSVDYENAISRKEAQFLGDKYRITILSDILIRFEYAEDGVFENRPTEFAQFRNFEKPEYRIRQDERYLEVTAKYFKLEYQKEKVFYGNKVAPDTNLRITLKGTDRVWYFGHPEARNFYGSANSLDDFKDKMDLKKGLFSTDGFASIDDSNSLIIDQDGFLIPGNSKRIDTYLFIYKRDFGLCLRDYFRLTGFSPLIPRYALGVWWNKDEDYNSDNVKELVTQFNRNEIPLSIILLGKKWHIKARTKTKDLDTGFTFNSDLISDPNELVKYLHERGVRIGLNINPTDGIMPHEEQYANFARMMGQTDNKIIPFNALDKNFINAYLNTVIKALDDKGIDFYWIDYYKNGLLRYLSALNYYHFNYGKNTKKRGLILSRNPLVASHRYPIHYSGETIVSWNTLKNLPYYNSTASNIGMSWWSHDIGGYKEGIEDEELYMRYVQLGTFSPIFRFAAKEGYYYKREPWRWNIMTLNVVREYCQLRHKLIPYLYSEAYKYHKVGLPLVQPLYYLYPQIYDEPIYRNSYFFGSGMYVSPITNKKDTIMNRVVERLFMPEGTWYDFKSGKKFPGNRRYVTFYKDEDYPVFAKSGSIIPMAEFDENINVTAAPKSMEIHIFPGQSNEYKLYEDDGYSSLHEEGYYIITSIDYNYQLNNYTVIIRPLEGKSGIIPEKRNYKLRFRNTKQADDVIVYLGEEKIKVESYIYDTDFIVEVNNVPTTKQLSVNCKGKDIEIDTIRLINDDINSILNDAKIKTTLKDELANILFSNKEIRRKRIAIRKLKRKGLDPKFVKMLIKLLEYIAEI